MSRLLDVRDRKTQVCFCLLELLQIANLCVGLVHEIGGGGLHSENAVHDDEQRFSKGRHGAVDALELG